jgi:AraC-like DNA-binding protein
LKEGFVLITSSASILNERKILAAAAAGIGEFIGRNGGNPQQVFSDAGVEETSLHDPFLALDLGSYVSMMESAAHRTGNDNFGLNFGQQFKPEMLGLMGGIALASPSLGAAVCNLAELFPYHQQATQTRITREHRLLKLEYRILDSRLIARRQDAEVTLGMFVNVFRHCLGPRWNPERVYCEHMRPAHWREHEQLFGAPVHFGQPTNAIVFSDQGLSRPMPGADLQRMSRLRDELIRLTGHVGPVSFIDAVRAEIRSCLPVKSLSVGGVADTLGFTRWTFQRYLADNGFSFSTLVDRVRRDLADVYLRQPHVAISDIAVALGYSELSALSRAFKRWYGVSPQQLRMGVPL